MSDLHFKASEIRLATATLAALAALVPLAYYLYPTQTQDSSEHSKTARKFLESYSTLRPQALTTHASRDFTHTSLPEDLHLPTRTIGPFREHAETVFEMFSNFQMTPLDGEVHFSRGTDTVIAHCKLGGKVNGESEMGAKLVAGGITEWWTEGVLFVKLSKDGKRVEGVREFMHSKKMEELQIRLGDVLSERAIR